MHAIELLLDDHEAVAGLFDRVRSNDEDAVLFEQIKTLLDAQRYVEESLFYPKLIEGGDEELKIIVNAAIEDHRQVNRALVELQKLDAKDRRFAPRLRLIMEDVEHHVGEEEERIFPLAEEQFDAETLENLGDEMAAEKMRFLGAYPQLAPA